MKILISLANFCLLTFLAVNLLIFSCLFITPVRAENINHSDSEIFKTLLPRASILVPGTYILAPDKQFWNDILALREISDCTLSRREVSEMNNIKAKIKASLSPNEFNKFKKYQPECQRANLTYTKNVWEKISHAPKRI